MADSVAVCRGWNSRRDDPATGRGVELEDEIVRRVGYAVDLLEYHVPLELEVALAEQRAPHQVGR